ncbi:MAG: glycosyltransferase family 4 protein [Candidatus Aegiribacteria sp.]|nr:glycosyltransferase family 4 protein [Candidatus Aegiribacteria sp.]
MHLIMDARALQIHVDGIGRYSLGVMKALSRLEPGWKLSVIVNPEAAPQVDGLPVETVKSSAVRFRRGENRELVPFIESSGADCYLNFSMAGPSPSIPTVLSVHDLMVLNMPGYFGSSFLRNILARFLFRIRIKRSIGHARAISVLSEASLSDLRRVFPGAEKKAFVAGAGQDLFSGDEKGGSERKDYLLYVGNARAYKNVTRLIVAYARLKAINPRFPEMKMVVRRDRAFGDFMRDVQECSATDSITVLSHVTDDELRKLYRSCTGLVIPSLKEGFGLPALEAMAAGSPVVASSGTALEELVGDAGILVNPESVEDIMRGMAILTSQPDLRRKLARKALERAGNYSWKKTASVIADRIGVITS